MVKLFQSSYAFVPNTHGECAKHMFVCICTIFIHVYYDLEDNTILIIGA